MFFGIEHSSCSLPAVSRTATCRSTRAAGAAAWTLGVEITFYLVAPFVLRSPRRLLALLAASLACGPC